MRTEKQRAAQRAADHKFRAAHLEDERQRDRDRYRDHRVEELARNRLYCSENKEKVNQRRRNYRHRITQEQFDSMMQEQNNCCANCSKEFTKTPHIDHDHQCCPLLRSCGNCRRGLLCDDCNLGLGRFHDSITLLSNAITYLEHWKQRRSNGL